MQIGHYMYIIGGYSDGICFSDVYILDLNSHQWRHVENSGTVVQVRLMDTTSICIYIPSCSLNNTQPHQQLPQGRASHCCCVGPGDRDIYMFGGSGPCWGRCVHFHISRFSACELIYLHTKILTPLPPLHNT